MAQMLMERNKGNIESLMIIPAPVRGSERGGCAWCICVFLLLFCAVVSAAESTQFDKLVKEGLAFHERADYAHAIPVLQRAVHLEPRNYMANMLLGVDLLRSGQLDGAMVHLEIAVTANPRDSSAAEALAMAATEAGDFARAAEVLQASVERSGRRGKPVQKLAGYYVERFRILGNGLRSTKSGEGVELRVEAAVHTEGGKIRASLLQKAVEDNPDQRGIWGELGVAQLELRDRAGVEASLGEAQKREPDGTETLHLKALLAVIEGRWTDAEKLLLAIGSRSPARLKRVLATWPPALVPGKEIQGAVWDCLRNPSVPRKLTAEQPEHADGLGAGTLYAQGRWEQLVSLPHSANWGKPEWLWRGVALAETGNCREAIPALERGLGTADGNYGLFWLEVCYAGEAEHAAAMLNDAGDKAAFHQLWGDVFLLLNQNADKAQEQYAEALKLRPNNPQLLERSAEALIALSQLDEARKFALAALALDPQQDDALRTLAEIGIKQRNYKGVIAPLKQLSVLHPADPWPRVELGRAYAQLDQPEQALHYLEPALASGYPDEKGGLHAILSRVLRRVGREEEAKQAAREAARLADAAEEKGQGEVHEQQ
jgi:tetratricopeptide (TPR) repeat protein